MLVLRTFGGLSLENGGRPLAGAAAQRGRLAILAVLAAAGETAVSRDRLHALFWPESDAERARGALKQALYALRRDAGERELTQGTSELRLNRDVITSDVQDFERALRSNDFEGAVALYTGPFLDGIYLRDAPGFDRWAESERDRLLHELRTALDHLGNTSDRRGDSAAAVEWWRRRAATEPLSARIARAYMASLVATGDREAAIRHARAYCDLVRSELGAEPDPSITTYIEALRTRGPASGGVVMSAAASPGAAPRDSISPPGPYEVPPDSIAARGTTRLRYAWLVAATLIVITASATFAALLRPARPLAIGITTQITSMKGPEVDPAISPDGKMVAYAAGPMDAMRIFVQQIDGGRAVPLTTDSTVNQRSPKWSPDGSRILFQTLGGIDIVPSLGGSPKRLIAIEGHRITSPSWSPDGKRIAYADDRGIWIGGVEGGAPQFVTSGGFQTHSPTWSPDGSHLAYVVGNLWYVDGNMAPSSIWIVSSAGGASTCITDRVHLNTAPVFTPDGHSILYVSNRDGARDVFQQPLRAGFALSGHLSRLTTGSNAFTIGLSSDGTRLAYSALTFRSNIYAAPITSGRPTLPSAAVQLTSDNESVEVVSVSRDGKWLIFDSNKHGNQDIYKLSLRGGEPIQLTTDPADDFAGVMSPDGSEIAYYSFRSGARHLHVMSADGTNDRAITNFTSHEWVPDWSPDGNQISFVSDRTGSKQPYIVDRAADGQWGTPRQIANLPGGSGSGPWSRDGRYIAVSGDSGVTIIPVNGQPPRVLVDGRKLGQDPGYTAWGPDPSLVYYSAMDVTGVVGFWSMPVAGGTPRLLLRLTDPSRMTRRTEFATDGKRIYFTVASDEADVWLADIKR